jgi:HAD superfamily hydrolase (TIGR01459 family)
MPEIPIHKGLSEGAERYDGFIVDLWGVMHDGVTAFPEAVACLRELKRRDKRILILSNAPRRAAEVTARNSALGIDAALVDVVMSSGEETWQALKQRGDPWYRALGARCYHLGPERDHGMRDGLDYDFVGSLAEADFVLLTGAFGKEDSSDDYRPLLKEAASRNLPMVCANPDLVVIRGGQREICAGSIALLYEQLGGEVRYHGKPHRPTYQNCFALLPDLTPGRIAAIGDSLRTDVAGAAAAGIDSIFVTEGIHEDELKDNGASQIDERRLAALLDAQENRPTGVMLRLRW